METLCLCRHFEFFIFALMNILACGLQNKYLWCFHKQNNYVNFMSTKYFVHKIPYTTLGRGGGSNATPQ